MRVLYFHQHFITPRGSGGTRSYEFARALITAGHSVTMVCGSHGAESLDLPFDPKHQWSRGLIDGIDVIALPLKYSNHQSLAQRTILFLRFAFRSAGLAIREEYDLLFATSTPLTASIPGLAMKFKGDKRPFVFEVRDLWPDLPRALGMKNPVLLGGMSILEWLSYRSADACIGLSPGIVQGISRRAPGKPVSMIPNGCDLTLFRPGNRQRLTLPGIAPGDFVAVFTGAHGIANGLDSVLDAATDLRRRGRHEIKLVFIGDGREKSRLQLRAAAEQLENCVFLPSMKKTLLAEITAGCDVGMMILANIPEFYYGTSPNKFFDYLSAGIPVLNNYPGWVADLIVQHECGIAVPPADPAAFATALITLADNSTLRTAMGARGRGLAESDFARDKLAAQFVQVLEKFGPTAAGH